MTNKFLHITSKAISILCHPLFVPTYGMIAFCMALQSRHLQPPTNFWLVACLGTCFLTCIIPMSLILFMIIRGQISDLYISAKEERTTPYIYSLTGFGFWCYFVYSILHTPPFLLYSAIGATVALLVVTIVNHWWKISAHSVAWGGLLGGICSYCLYYNVLLTPALMTILAVSLIIMYARLYLNAHSPIQLISGYLLGLLLTSIPNLILYHA